MSRVVLTRKMLDMISTGIADRETIITDELSHISFNSVTDCDPHLKENKKRCEAEWKLCQAVNDWIYAVKQKRGYQK
jgi:hypothetical protein|tara:strand:+ start:225 stop:455 length:231 start_codon:yes stop_codon:yes gene_type:complete